jgi:hypothetical protein
MSDNPVEKMQDLINLPASFAKEGSQVRSPSLGLPRLSLILRSSPGQLGSSYADTLFSLALDGI